MKEKALPTKENKIRDESCRNIGYKRDSTQVIKLADSTHYFVLSTVYLVLQQ